MSINIQYFAILKDQSGISEENVPATYSNAAELYIELQAKHSFTLGQANLKVAINDEFADWDTPLNDGDSVAFIPPVAGG